MAALCALALAPAFAGTASVSSGDWSNSSRWNNGSPVNGNAAGIVNGASITFQAGNSYTSGALPAGLTIGTAGDPEGVFTGSGNGILNITGGTLISSWTGIGRQRLGTMNISGGAVTLQNTLALGWETTPGSSINVSGGNLTLSGVESAAVGWAVPASLNVSGTGTVNVNRELDVRNGSTVGISGGGILVVGGIDKILRVGFDKGSGTILQSGGSATFHGNLWLGNAADGVGTYELSGGTWTQNGLLRMGVFASGSGVIHQTGGVFELKNEVHVWGGAPSRYDLDGGTFKVGAANVAFHNFSGGFDFNLRGHSGNVTVNTQNFDFTAYNSSTFNNASAVLTKIGGGKLHLAGGAGTLQIENGSLSMQTGTLETDGSMVIGQNGGTAALNLSGGAVRYGYPHPANFIVGINGGTGSVNQTGGILQTDDQNYALGWNGHGTHTLTAGSVDIGGAAFVGLYVGGVGALNINGGSFTTAGMQISAGGAASGSVNVNGGTLGAGSIIIQANGLLALNGGPTSTTGDLDIYAGGTLRFGGGSLAVNAGANSIHNSGTLDLNGQTIAANAWHACLLAAKGSRLINSSASPALIANGNTIELASAGTTIETIGDMVIDSVLTDHGNGHTLVKTGPGALRLTHSGTAYSGHTFVVAGTLGLSHPSLADAADVRLATDGRLALDFSGIDAVNALYIDSVKQAPGTWGAPGSGATHQSSRISGPGILHVGRYDAWATSFGPAFTDPTEGADIDNDGLDNLLEFVLGGDPTRSDGESVRPTVGIPETGLLTISFNRSLASRFLPVALRLQVSDDLVTWNPADEISIGDSAGSGPNGVTYSVTANGGSMETIVVTIPKGEAVSKFARLVATGEATESVLPVGDLPQAPADYLAFSSPGRDTGLQHLRNLSWSIYQNPPGYASLWFPWMVGAEMAQGGPLSAQKRQNWANVLETTKIYPDGYVSVGQHYSHAHDGGWPFPNWPQIFEPNQFRGYTAGWHFQDQTEGFIRLFFMEQIIRPAGYAGDAAVAQWATTDLASDGRINGLWHLRATGAQPAITWQGGPSFRADCAPFVQIRLRSNIDAALPANAKVVMQWTRQGDGGFSTQRQIELPPLAPDPWERVTHLNHLHFAGWQHPLWNGNITGLRFLMTGFGGGAEFDIDSIFTAFDTRHPVTNPGFILGSADFFRWTGDAGFLSRNIGRMRDALQFCRTELGGNANKFIRVPWTGHDGRGGYLVNPNGSWSRRYGVGIGNNYWDLLPFGGDDMYATTYFYASLLAMAEIEEWISANAVASGIGAAPAGSSAADLRNLAAEVKTVSNIHFWNEESGRFIACIDRDGVRHDFGYTFVNLEAVHYGLASDEHSARILDWIAGDRIVAGDTSTGSDIYRFRFAPRASTLRNPYWYLWAWPGMDIPWGGQVQDGGAVLGFAYHDLMSRLKHRGVDDAAGRMDEMLDWLKEAQDAGGIRPYYASDPSLGTLQGGGPAGGLGVDNEFVETQLWPSFVLSGFVGFRPTAAGFSLDPQLPVDWPSLNVSHVAFRGSTLDFEQTGDSLRIHVNGTTPGDFSVNLPAGWAPTGVAPSAEASIHTVQLMDGTTLVFTRP